MPRWTVNVGAEDSIVLERAADGLVAIDIPAHRPALATREEVEELRRKLGAAIADDSNADDRSQGDTGES